MILLDSNAVLRFILKDVSKQHKKIIEFISLNPSAVRLEVLVEIIYVLEKFYKKSRMEIVNIIAVLGQTKNILIQFPRVVEKSLFYYVEENMDIVDCILCAFNSIFGYGVFTFDKKMNLLLQKTAQTDALPSR